MAGKQVTELPQFSGDLSPDDLLYVRRALDDGDYRLSLDQLAALAARRIDLPTVAPPGAQRWVPDCPKPPGARSDEPGALCVFDGLRWVRACDYGSMYTVLEQIGAEYPALYSRFSASTLFQNADRSVPVDAAGQTVGLIADESPNGWDAVSSVVSQRAEWDGQMLRNDGVDDRYDAETNLVFEYGKPLYLAIAYETDGEARDYAPPVLGLSASRAWEFRIGFNSETGDSLVYVRSDYGSNGFNFNFSTPDGQSSAFAHPSKHRSTGIFYDGDQTVGATIDGVVTNTQPVHSPLENAGSSGPMTLSLFASIPLGVTGIAAIQYAPDEAELMSIHSELMGTRDGD